MSNSTLAKARGLRGWVHQRSRESLSHTALNLLLPCQSRQSNRLQTGESPSSTHNCCKAITFRRPILSPSALSQSFNAHRASIVERFSPIHF
jgi:hypothetical protein